MRRPRDQCAVADARGLTGRGHEQRRKERHPVLSLYVPILILAALAAIFAASRSSWARSRAPSGGTGPLQAYGAGSSRPATAGRRPFPVKYYVTAMLFILSTSRSSSCTVGGHLHQPRGIRAGRDGAVYRHGAGRVRLRVAARRAELGLAMGIEEKLPSGILLTSVRNWPGTRARVRCGHHVRPGLLRDGTHLHRRSPPRPGQVRHGAGVEHAARPTDDRGGPGEPEDGAGAPADL
jgi:hypothetical protein